MLRRSLLIAHLGPSRVLVSATSYRALSSSSARPGRGPSNFGLLDAEDSVDFDSDIHSRSSGRGSPSSRGRKERSSSSFGSRKPKSTGTDSTFLRPLDGRGEEGGSQLWKRSGDFDSDLADIYEDRSAPRRSKPSKRGSRSDRHDASPPSFERDAIPHEREPSQAPREDYLAEYKSGPSKLAQPWNERTYDNQRSSSSSIGTPVPLPRSPTLPTRGLRASPLHPRSRQSSISNQTDSAWENIHSISDVRPDRFDPADAARVLSLDPMRRAYQQTNEAEEEPLFYESPMLYPEAHTFRSIPGEVAPSTLVPMGKINPGWDEIAARAGVPLRPSKQADRDWLMPEKDSTPVTTFPPPHSTAALDPSIDDHAFDLPPSRSLSHNTDSAFPSSSSSSSSSSLLSDSSTTENPSKAFKATAAPKHVPAPSRSRYSPKEASRLAKELSVNPLYAQLEALQRENRDLREHVAAAPLVVEEPWEYRPFGASEPVKPVTSSSSGSGIDPFSTLAAKPGVASRLSLSGTPDGWENRLPAWAQAKNRLRERLGEGETWNPHRKVTREAMQKIRALHADDPEKHSATALSKEFGISHEATRRILRSGWRTGEDREIEKEMARQKAEEDAKLREKLGEVPPMEVDGESSGERKTLDPSDPFGDLDETGAGGGPADAQEDAWQRAGGDAYEALIAKGVSPEEAARLTEVAAEDTGFLPSDAFTNPGASHSNARRRHQERSSSATALSDRPSRRYIPLSEMLDHKREIAKGIASKVPPSPERHLLIQKMIQLKEHNWRKENGIAPRKAGVVRKGHAAGAFGLKEPEEEG